MLSPSDVQYLPIVSDFYKDFKKDAKFLLDSQNNIYLKWDKVLSPKFSMLKWEEAFDRRSDEFDKDLEEMKKQQEEFLKNMKQFKKRF